MLGLSHDVKIHILGYVSSCGRAQGSGTSVDFKCTNCSSEFVIRKKNASKFVEYLKMYLDICVLE